MYREWQRAAGSPILIHPMLSRRRVARVQEAAYRKRTGFHQRELWRPAKSCYGLGK